MNQFLKILVAVFCSIAFMSSVSFAETLVGIDGDTGEQVYSNVDEQASNVVESRKITTKSSRAALRCTGCVFRRS